MKNFFQKSIGWVIVVAVLGGILWYVGNNDVQSLGASHIAFTIEDASPRYNGASLYKKDYYQYPCEWNNDAGTRIINPSPQRYVLVITNTDTGQEFTLRHRDILSGTHYKIIRKTLDGEVISKHQLTIHR